MTAKNSKKEIVLLCLILFVVVIFQPSLALADNRIEVMGFYLGMTVDVAVKNLNKLGINFTVDSTGISFGSDMGNWLQQDNNNKINYMLFTYKLFDAQDLYLDDFVKKFSFSYRLSPMKFDSMRDAYYYKTSNAEVLIPADPMGIVIIQTIPKTEFNIKG